MWHGKNMLSMEFPEDPSIASHWYVMRGEWYVWIFREIPIIEDDIPPRKYYFLQVKCPSLSTHRK
jgi:hypothetical protein